MSTYTMKKFKKTQLENSDRRGDSLTASTALFVSNFVAPILKIQVSYAMVV
jgi:hypothetical protein